MNKLKVFIIVFILTNQAAQARSTYEQILDNKPSIDRTYALKLSIIIDSIADKYKIPANAIASIAMVESSYKLNAINRHSNDFGIMQINSYNIKAYKLDRDRLLTDLNYSVESGAKIFKWFYKTYGTLEEATKRYNCGTKKSCTTWKGPIKYWSRVVKYL